MAGIDFGLIGLFLLWAAWSVVMNFTD